MPIVALPYTLVNGTMADADQVMDNLAELRDAINGQLDAANLAASAGITEAQLVAGAAGLAKGAFRVYNSSDQGPTRGNPLTFNSEAFDIGGNHAAGIYTAPVKGVYRFEWQMIFQSVIAAADWVQSRLRVGGVPKIKGTRYVGGLGIAGDSIGTATLSLGAGDLVTIDFDAATANPYTVSGEESSYFAGHLVGRLP